MKSPCLTTIVFGEEIPMLGSLALRLTQTIFYITDPSVILIRMPDIKEEIQDETGCHQKRSQYLGELSHWTVAISMASSMSMMGI